MLALDLVVAIRRDHERTGRVDAAAEDPEHVESRLVGPVQVLEDEDAGSAQLVEERRGDARLGSAERRRATAFCAATSRKGPSGVGVVRFSQAPTSTRPLGAARERAHERGLADAGLAADEDEPAALARAASSCASSSSRSSRAPPPTARYRVCGKPRSTFDVAGSGQRDVTTLPRV